MPTLAQSVLPFDCVVCGLTVGSVAPVKGAKPHLRRRLCGPCKGRVNYAERTGRTVDELRPRRPNGRGKKLTRAKSTVGQSFPCRVCGRDFVKRSDSQKYCGDRCARESDRDSASFSCRCAWCDSEMTRSKRNESGVYFCKHECQWSYKRCVVDGVSAKTWPRMQPCVQCAKPYETKSKHANARCPECRSEALAERRQQRGNEPMPPRTRFVAGRCRRCDEPFVVDRQQYMAFGYYCSKRCGRRDARDRRNARKRAAYVADVWRPKVYQRDRYRCQICGGKLAMNKKAPHPKSPTIDHIVPLSRGGTHEPANCQAAHFICNSQKSNGTAPGGDQLLLVG